MSDVKILIVEDEENLAFTLSQALQRASGGEYLVETSHSGREAVPLFATQRYDLVISDLRLPDISGLSLLAKVRELHPTTRTIMMTAFGSEQVEERAHEYTDAYLTKPFNLPEMIQLVKNVIRQTKTDDNPQVMLVENSYPRINNHHDKLRNEVGAPYIMLLDLNGHVLVDNGQPSTVNKSLINALLCNSMAAATEVANAFNEPKPFDLHYYDGENYEIYCRKIDGQMFLALIIDLHANKARMGSVWLSLKQAVANIREETEELDKLNEQSTEMLDDSFNENLEAALSDALFSDNPALFG